ncbi:MAG: hypothetical protein ACYDB7_00670 [Mycobacteriales bacterium]
MSVSGTSVSGSGLTAAQTATPGGHGKAHRRRPALGLLSRVEHGVLVVHVKGGTQTLDVQRGVVMSVSATSVTLRSADGFVGTYALTATSKVRAPHPAGTKPSAADVHRGFVAEVIAVQQASGPADVRVLVARPVHRAHPTPTATSSAAGVAS